MKDYFKNISINKIDKTFTVHEGSVGTYRYEDVVFSQIIYEEDRYKDKSELFSHVLYKKSLYANFFYPGNVWCGLSIHMRNGFIVYVYVSEDATQFNSLQFHEDTRKAQNFVEFLKNHRVYFKNITFNTNDKTFFIAKGDVGNYSYIDVIKCKVEIEYSDYFSQINQHATLSLNDTGDYGKVKILIRLRDDRLLEVYISNKEVLLQSSQFLNDRIEAEEIKKLLKRIIKKYNTK